MGHYIVLVRDSGEKWELYEESDAPSPREAYRRTVNQDPNMFEDMIIYEVAMDEDGDQVSYSKDDLW